MESIRNKLGWGLSGALALLLLAALAGVVHGGPLDPTAPPGSTGKNVITSLPFTISQPGSYILNSNLTGVGGGQSGIIVTTNNVTIDLQGFELVGVPGSGHGITHLSGSQSGLTVRNGTVRNWGQLGISAGLGLSVDGVSFKANNGGVFGGDGATLTNCRIEGSIGTSSILGNRAVVSKCTFDSNGPGCNTCPGIQVGQDSTVTESIASNNGGIEIQAGDRSTIENCVADGAGGTVTGIDVGASAIVRGCTAANNGAEIAAGDRSLIEACVADGWTGSARGPGGGVVVGTASVVRGCTVANNANGGIVVVGANNRIEGNHVRANSINGIYVGATTGNVVVQNDSALNGPTGSVSENCTDGGNNDFEKKTSAAAAGAFDNLCD
jgi:parallel beta-helix repeat protein